MLNFDQVLGEVVDVTADLVELEDANIDELLAACL